MQSIRGNYSQDNPPRGFIAEPFSYHEEVQLEISDITNLGIGIGRVNKWVVMVSYVCVGEIVIARIYKNFKNYSVADLVSVMVPSADRIHPPCQLFGICGGCQYQHIKYETQLTLKRKQVSDVISQIAGLKCFVNECLYSDQEYNYRSKITPHFQKSVPPIGFLKCDRRQIVDVEKCPIATEAINAALPGIRRSISQKQSSLKRGGTILLRDVGGKIISDTRAIVSERVNDFEFFFCAGEFFQNNPYVLPKMVDFIVSCARGTKYLIDAYCGVGVFGIVTSSNFEKVVGIEINSTAISLAKRNAIHNNVDNIKFIEGDSKEIFENIDFQGRDTTIIIDPPRTGCSKEFLQQLMSFSPKKIVYISCAPDTQARDLKFISQEYSIDEVQPIDMFPQTRHIENVVCLEKFP